MTIIKMLGLSFTEVGAVPTIGLQLNWPNYSLHLYMKRAILCASVQLFFTWFLVCVVNDKPRQDKLFDILSGLKQGKIRVAKFCTESCCLQFTTVGTILTSAGTIPTLVGTNTCQYECQAQYIYNATPWHIVDGTFGQHRHRARVICSTDPPSLKVYQQRKTLN